MFSPSSVEAAFNRFGTFFHHFALAFFVASQAFFR
jgi:hypothetical protein